MVQSRRLIVARARPSALEVATERLDVGAARTEQRDVAFGAPGDVLAEIQRVRVAGQAAITSQEPDQREFLLGTEQHRSKRNRRSRKRRSLHVATSSIGRDPITRTVDEPRSH